MYVGIGNEAQRKLLRPDGDWSVMLVNKDQENAHPVHIVFEDTADKKQKHFSGPVSAVTFGSEQYQWHSNIGRGRADPDGPAKKLSVVGDAGTAYMLPKASITVIRGRLSGSNPGPKATQVN